MEPEKHIKALDWERMFYPTDETFGFLAEIGLRTAVMFLLLIVALKFLSKRGVKQLSVFELAILIALGSATGDPMFYSQVPLTYGMLVLLVVIFLYRLITLFAGRSKKLEIILEGKPVYLIAEGRINYETYHRIGLPYDKFFAELRLRGVDHLGQVRRAYLDTSGEISLYFFDDTQVVPGLPIYPEVVENPVKMGPNAPYACLSCGAISNVSLQKDGCPTCHEHQWLSPIAVKRVR